MSRFHAVPLVFIAALAWAAPAWAAGEPVKAGVFVSEPFVQLDEEGRFSGVVIDLWRQLEKRLNLETEYILYHNFGQMLEAASQKEIDVVVAALAVTHERTLSLHYSFPWYNTGLRIMVRDDKPDSLWTKLKNDGRFQSYLKIFLLLIFLAWLQALVRRRLDENFPKSWREGLAVSFYEVLKTARSGSISHHYLGWAGYLLGSFWMIFGVGVVAYITSTVTSTMTTASLTAARVTTLADLKTDTIGVVGGSMEELYLKRLGLKTAAFNQNKEIIQALMDGGIGAVVSDAPGLEHWVHQNPEAGVRLAGDLFYAGKYALAANLDRRDLINRVSVELIDLLESGEVAAIDGQYFGPDQTNRVTGPVSLFPRR